MKSSSRGQTLIEVLISLAIFSLVLVPFISSIINLTSSHLRYQHQIQATQLARESLEIAYNLAVNNENFWSSFCDKYGAENTVWSPIPGKASFSPVEQNIDGRFSRSAIFTKKDDNLKVLSQVEWTERGKNQKVILETILVDFNALVL